MKKKVADLKPIDTALTWAWKLCIESQLCRNYRLVIWTMWGSVCQGSKGRKAASLKLPLPSSWSSGLFLVEATPQTHRPHSSESLRGLPPSPSVGSSSTLVRSSVSILITLVSFPPLPLAADGQFLSLALLDFGQKQKTVISQLKLGLACNDVIENCFAERCFCFGPAT